MKTPPAPLSPFARRLTVLALVAGFLSLAGCGSSPEGELMKKWIDHMDETRTILAKVQDEASAKAALPELQASIDSFEKAVADANVDLKAQVPERVMKEYFDKFEKAGNRLRGEKERVQNRHPEAWRILEDTVAKIKRAKSPAERVLGR